MTIVIGVQSSARKWWNEPLVFTAETEIIPPLAMMIEEQTVIDAMLSISFSLVCEAIEILCRE